MLPRIPSFITQSRHGIYYFQLRIPADKQHLFDGRVLFRKSLATRDRRKAVQLARRWWLIVTEKMNLEWEEDANFEAELFSRGRALSTEHDAIHPQDSIAHDEFFLRLSDFDKRALKYFAEHSPTATSIAIAAPSGETSPPLSQLMERYIRERKIQWQGGSETKTEAEVRGKLKYFIEVVGDITADRLTKQITSNFKEVLLATPKNRNKKKHYASLSPDQFLTMDIPAADKMSATTHKEYLNVCASFLRWCAKNGFAATALSDPLEGVIKSSKAPSDDRHTYSQDELVSLFNSKQYTEGSHKCLEHYWLPLLALFTGARQNELCQLHSSDVYTDTVTGLLVIDINDSDDKKIKTRNAKRVLPVHSRLIAMGFPEFVESRKGQTHLFNLKYSAKNGFGDQLSKWFNRTYMNERNCNIVKPKKGKKDFYSFRHTFIDGLKQLDVPEPRVGDFAGQSSGKSLTFNRYGKASSLESRKKLVELLQFSFIDFDAIKHWKSAVVKRNGRKP